MALLGGLPLGLQIRQRPADPVLAPHRVSQLARQLIPPRAAIQLILGRVHRLRPARISRASSRSRFSVRFASFDAFAAIFVPSSAISPSFPSPAAAASTSTWPNRSSITAASAKYSRRNRATVA